MKALIGLCGCLFCFSYSAGASGEEQGSALMLLLRALHANGTIDAATYAQVLAASANDAATAVAGKPAASGTRPDRSAGGTMSAPVAATIKEPGKTKPAIRVGGRIQTDAARYSDPGRGHNDGTEIRRARLFALGDLGTNWAFKLQYDFTADGIDGIQDAYLDYNGMEQVRLRLGHFKEPFSLQNMTSSKYVTFIERSLPHVFAEGRNPGLAASYNRRNWSLSAGVFADGREAADNDNDEGWGLSGRLTWAPYLGDTGAWHVGLSAAHRNTGTTNELRFRERPESHVTNTRLVDTGVIDANSLTRLVFESAFIHGSVHLTGEYYLADVDRAGSGNTDTDFSGFYVEGGWFLTGESLDYRAGSGSFSRVVPHTVAGEGGWGAWQLAGRFSHVDLTDGDIDGGEADSFTVGLNWYATRNIRFSANYVNVLDLDGGPSAGSDPEVFTLRAQLEF